MELSPTYRNTHIAAMTGAVGAAETARKDAGYAATRIPELEAMRVVCLAKGLCVESIDLELQELRSSV